LTRRGVVSFDAYPEAGLAMYRITIASLLTAATAAILPAQIADPGTGVGMGHHHLRASDADYDAYKKLLVEGLGARVAQLGTLEAFLIPDAVILVAKGDLQGPSVGTAVDHIGFHVKDLAAAEAKWKAAGGVMMPNKPSPTQSFLEMPGGTKVELSEDKSLDVPIRNHHMHLYPSSDSEAQSWYIKMFGATPGTRGPFKTGNLPGVELTFSVAATPVAGSQGRAIDHIGFEVNNLEEFCKQLEAKGAKFDRPFRSIPQIGLNIAFLTDPWGGYIELTEGLSKLK
jgi:catechol 2,3-dioxygenase-like lactoylglutathione lyase family enzyme